MKLVKFTNDTVAPRLRDSLDAAISRVCKVYATEIAGRPAYAVLTSEGRGYGWTGAVYVCEPLAEIKKTVDYLTQKFSEGYYVAGDAFIAVERLSPKHAARSKQIAFLVAPTSKALKSSVVKSVRDLSERLERYEAENGKVEGTHASIDAALGVSVGREKREELRKTKRDLEFGLGARVRRIETISGVSTAVSVTSYSFETRFRLKTYQLEKAISRVGAAKTAEEAETAAKRASDMLSDYEALAQRVADMLDEHAHKIAEKYADN